MIDDFSLFLSCFSPLKNAPTLGLDPFSPFYTLSLVDLKWWENFPLACGSLHPCWLGGLLSLGYCFSVSNPMSEVGPIVLFLARFPHYLDLMPNLMLNWRTPLRHYFSSSRDIGCLLGCYREQRPEQISSGLSFMGWAHG